MDCAGSNQDVRHRFSPSPDLLTHPLSLPSPPLKTSLQVTPSLDQLKLHDQLTSKCHGLPSSRPRRVLNPSLQISVRASASHKTDHLAFKSPCSPPLIPLPALPSLSSPSPSDSSTAILSLAESSQTGAGQAIKKPLLLRQASCPGAIFTDLFHPTSHLTTITTSVPTAQPSSSNNHNSKACRTVS